MRAALNRRRSRGLRPSRAARVGRITTRNPSPRAGPPLGSYAAPLAYVALAATARFLLVPVLGAFENFGPFYLAVLASALSGVAPGALAAFGSAFFVWYFFVPPAASPLLQDPAAAFSLVVFGLCSAAIVALAAAYQRMRGSNERANELFRTVQDISAEAVVVYRAVRKQSGEVEDFEYSYANPAALALMAMSDASEIVGRRLLERLPIARAHPLLFARYAGTLASGAASTAEYELGGRWYVSTAAKLGDGLVVTAQDITERRRSEDAQRLLLHELNHRVKNILASAIAMATVTDRGSCSIGEFRDKFVKRLQALSRAHSLLLTRSWTDAEIEQIVRSTLEPYLHADSSRFVLAGPAIAISTGVALALHMALYELATNAAKYGALSTLRGRVAIDWAPDPEEAEYVILNWTESDGPDVQAPRRAGFGMRLFQQAFAAEGGAATLEFLPEGAHCQMRFKSGAQPSRMQGVGSA